MITPIYAGLLGFLYFKISLDTIKARKREQVSLGTGKNDEIIAYVSAHSNFSSYVPLLLIGLFLLEQQSIPKTMLHIAGVSILVGRILHYTALTTNPASFKNRVRGMKLTLFPLVVISTLNIYYSVF